MTEYQLIQGESSQSFDIGYADPDTGELVVLGADDLCTLHVVQSIQNQKEQAIVELNSFPKSLDGLYFKTKLKPSDSELLKSGDYYIVWKLVNIAKDFALEHQAKLKVLPSGIHN
ncbi:MAG: hypothetical protein KC646_10305 [Candidatus Cloacimonetes bacterium]|nr:hypothetical protein [Candidatus Cloacimonadota bacterium]